MQFLRLLVEQIQRLWERTTGPARVGIALTTAICLLAVAGVGFWATRPEYVVVASNLTPSETAEITSQLESQSIPFQLNFSGTAVLVAEAQLSQVRVLLGDAISPAQPGIDQLGDSPWMDPTMSQVRILRAREGELGRSIERMEPVAHARVHISIPESSPFVRSRNKPKASVVLQLRPGATMTAERAAAVVSLVSNSVDGLEPDQVTVLDTKGRLLSSATSPYHTEVATNLEYRQQLENYLSSKAELMLNQLLGPDRSVVQVSADIDFTQVKATETTFDPESKVVVSERSTNKKSTSPSEQTSGVVGARANSQGGRSAKSKSKMVNTQDDTRETEYEIPKSVEEVIQAVGTIRRLTVSAMIDLPDTTSDPNAPAGPTITKEEAENIIKHSVGYDDTRSDQIQVVFTKLAGPAALDDTDTTLLAAQQWEKYTEMVRNGSLGLASVVALILGLLLLRKMRPITIPGPGASGDRQLLLNELTNQAQQNPEAVANIVSSWLEENRPEEPMKPAA